MRKQIALSMVVFMLFTLLPVGAFAVDSGSEVTRTNEKTVVFTIGQEDYKAGDSREVKHM